MAARPGTTEDAASGRDGDVPLALRRFAGLWARGEFWEAHEALEGPWRATRSDLLQGLILLASAWVHVGRGNPRGIDAQLRKALERLDGQPDSALGVDVDFLRRYATRMRDAVASAPPGLAPDEWARLLPPPPLLPDPALLRGDEPELPALEAAGEDPG